MAQEWYYSQNGQKRGPVSGADLKQLAASGKLQPTDLIWKQGMEKWVPARLVKGLFPPAAPPVGTPAPPPLPPKAVPDAADSVEPAEALPAEEEAEQDRPAPASSPGLWGFFGKVREKVEKARETVQKVKETVQKATAPPPPTKDPASQLPVLETLGVGRILAKSWLTCNNCKTKLKKPPPEWGRLGICPSCRTKCNLPLRGKNKEDFVRQLADLLRLDVTSPTMYQALDHAVEVLEPTVGKGGILSFLQMKVIADQIRQNSVRQALEEGQVGKLIEGQLKVNLDDPLVVAAGTPWKLFLWLVNEQFGGCHNNAHFEGSVGHSNPDVNSAYFIIQNNLAYEDDPCTKFTTTMLENLANIAIEHQQAVQRQQAAALQQQLLDQQIAAQQQAAYQQAGAIQQPGFSPSSWVGYPTDQATSQPTSGPTTPQALSASEPAPAQRKETTRRAPAVALMGAVIVEDQGDVIVYQKKCEKCGRVDSSRTTTPKQSGVMSGFFPCVHCRNQQDIRIRFS
jgi:hypothetical protein